MRALKPFKADVDSEEEQVNFDAAEFDNLGRSMLQNLRRGGDVSFEPNDLGVFPQEKADELIDGGLAEQIHSVYIRRLNDYQVHFYEIYEQFYAIKVETLRVNRDTKSLADANQKTQAQIKERTVERDRLKQDLTGHQRDRQAIQDLEKALTAQREQLVARLRELHTQNSFLAKEMKRLDEAMADEINRRTGAAVGGTD